MPSLKSFLKRINKSLKASNNLEANAPITDIYQFIAGKGVNYQGLPAPGNAFEMQTLSTQPVIALQKEFHLEDYFEPELGYEAGARILGSGTFGKAILYRYKFYGINNANLSAEQRRIKEFCDEDGFIVVKRALDSNGVSESEGRITNYLAEYPGKYNQAIAATIINESKQKEAIILSKYVCFCKNPGASKAKARNKSYSLLAFLQKMHDVATGIPRKTEKKTKKIGAVATNVYTSTIQDFDILFAQLGSGMMESIRALHAAGIYHLDVAPRNFLMDKLEYDEQRPIRKFALLAADFGEAVHYDPNTGLSEQAVRSTGPMRWLDIATLSGKNRQYTARTDLYAFRVSLLNMLAMDLGYDEKAPIFIESPGESPLDEVQNRITKCGKDSVALEIYLNNLRNLLNKKQTPPLNAAIKKRVETFINCYGFYIVHTPWDHPVTDETDIRKADYQRFMAANEQFFLETLKARLSALNLQDVQQAQAFKLSLARLFEMAVSKEFKEFNLYQYLSAYLQEADAQALDVEHLWQSLNEAFQTVAIIDRQQDFVTPQPTAEFLPVEEDQVPENTIMPPEPSINTIETDVTPNIRNTQSNAIEEQAHLDVEPLTTTELTIELDKLNKLFKDNSCYYHSAFYSKLNPLRHRFVSTEREVFEGLAVIKEALLDEIALLKKHADLLQLYKKDNKKDLKSLKKKADDALKMELRQLDFKLRSLRKKYINYQQYLLLALENFKRQFQKLTENDRERFTLLKRDFAHFMQILPAAEYMHLYNFWLDIVDPALVKQVEQLNEQMQQRAHQVSTSSVELQHKNVVIRGMSALAASEIQSTEKTPLLKDKGLEQSLVAWQKILKQEKSWQCKKVKNNKYEILVQPKKSKLSFVVDVVDNSIGYQRDAKLLKNNKLDFVHEEEKLMTEMVKAFLKTGSHTAEIEGSKILCDQIVKQLKKHKHIQEIKVNGQVVLRNQSTSEKSNTKKVRPSLD